MTKSNKPGYVDSFRRAFELFQILINAVLNEGGDERDMDSLFTKPELRKQIAKMIIGVKKVATDSFRVKVDYKLSVSHFDFAFDRVSEDYRKQAKFEVINPCKAVNRKIREIEFEYVHLNYRASADEVLVEIDKRGLRPALYEELLSFAKQYPDEQRQFPIVAFGSVRVHLGGGRYAAYLDGDSDERSIRLRWYNSDWDGNCRFLAVEKK